MSLRNFTKAQVMEAASISKGQVDIMQKAKLKLGPLAARIGPWHRARKLAEGGKEEPSDIEDWKEQMAEDDADRLAEAFGNKLSTNPGLAAMAFHRSFGRKLPELYHAVGESLSDADRTASEGEDDEDPAFSYCVTEPLWWLNQVTPFQSAAGLEQFTATLGAVVDGLRKGPVPLSHKQIVALSGDVYRAFIAQWEAEPDSPGRWAAFEAFTWAIREGRLGSAPTVTLEDAKQIEAAVEAFGRDLTAGVHALPSTDGLPCREMRGVLRMDPVHQIRVNRFHVAGSL